MRQGDAETRGRGEQIDWKSVKRVLVVRLRSIGDTVLATPSLVALRRFLPNVQIDVLLEDWVAPLLDGHAAVSNVISVSRKGKKSRFEVARRIRRENYDVAFNLHGGTTATFFVRASGAPVRVGFSHYRYRFLYTHLLSSSADFWQREFTHSAEQQLALLGFIGIPVEDRPNSSLTVSADAKARLQSSLRSQIANQKSQIALIHPAAAFDSKQWSTKNFAKVIDHLSSRNILSVVITTPKEGKLIDQIRQETATLFHGFTDLSLPEIASLAGRASLFIGNDSGIAHIAAAVGTPSVVIFGSSNINHWRPWTDAPHEIVHEKLPCQPCAGYVCKEFGEPKCIQSVKVEDVVAALERLIRKQK